ncbi:MAG: hypothetical protein JNM25_19625 [Planctomycetes bacterium]|nr:hypothetical protein [Planctomycetota bacterium]
MHELERAAAADFLGDPIGIDGEFVADGGDVRGDLCRAEIRGRSTSRVARGSPNAALAREPPST